MTSAITNTVTITETEQGMAVSGKLVFFDAQDNLKKGNSILKSYAESNQAKAVEIDFESMNRIDSAGIAILIEWQRQCAEAKIACRFIGLSKQAASLIKAYRLDSLIAS